ncbi:hypothetical protein D9M70_188280 [compost metagenome]
MHSSQGGAGRYTGELQGSWPARTGPHYTCQPPAPKRAFSTGCNPFHDRNQRYAPSPSDPARRPSRAEPRGHGAQAAAAAGRPAVCRRKRRRRSHRAEGNGAELPGPAQADPGQRQPGHPGSQQHAPSGPGQPAQRHRPVRFPPEHRPQGRRARPGQPRPRPAAGRHPAPGQGGIQRTGHPGQGPGGGLQGAGQSAQYPAGR